MILLYKYQENPNQQFHDNIQSILNKI